MIELYKLYRLLCAYIVYLLVRGGLLVEYISVKEASEKWGYGEATIRKWCRAGLLSVVCKAEKTGGHWKIPAAAQCPKAIKKGRE